MSRNIGALLLLVVSTSRYNITRVSVHLDIFFYVQIEILALYYVLLAVSTSWYNRTRVVLVHLDMFFYV